MATEDLRAVDSHFAFGKNWASYAQLVGDGEIGEAERGLERLISRPDLLNKTFLDIGCGSGLHALAAIRLGAARVLAVDIDADSVGTAAALLGRYDLVTPYEVAEVSVFELDPHTHGVFDIVYSWGVLHHTGDIDEAIRRAAAMVQPGGQLALALYRKTRSDRFWVREKRWYAGTSPRWQSAVRKLFVAAFAVRLRTRGQRFRDHVAHYRSRGMDFNHDVHDWLGGYPYEAVMPSDVDRILRPLGFAPVVSPHAPKQIGLLGSGCDEYVYRRLPNDDSD